MRSGTGVLQKHNSEMADLNSANFQSRGEPNFSMQKVLSMMEMLPGLVGLWPLSSVHNHGQSLYSPDFSPHGHDLILQNTPTINNYGLTPYTQFLNASSQFLYHPDDVDLDILGTETYIGAALRGLSMGVWVRVMSSTGGNQLLLAKWSPGPGQQSYQSWWVTSNSSFVFQVSNGGVTYTISSKASLSYAKWYFVAGRFTPSVEMKMYTNRETWINRTSIPASITNSTSPFLIGANGTLASPTNCANANMYLAFLTASTLPDSFFYYIYEHTKALFGYKTRTG